MRHLLFLVLTFTVIGCASTTTQPIASATTESLKGKSITVIQRESPTFVAMTSKKGMFAVVGVGAAAAAGNKLVEEKQIPDPALKVGVTLAETLAETHEMVLVDSDATQSTSNRLEDIVSLAQGSDYVIDIATNGWSYMYDGFKFSDYYVGYSAKLRLVDTSTREVVSSGYCAYDAKKAGKTAVTHDELLHNDAEYIKSELAAAADHCIAQFRADLIQGDAPALAMQ